MEEIDICENMKRSFRKHNVLKNKLYEKGFSRESLENVIRNSTYDGTIDVFVLYLLDVKLQVTCVINYNTGRLVYKCACYNSKRDANVLYKKKIKIKKQNKNYWQIIEPVESYSYKDAIEWIEDKIRVYLCYYFAHN